MKLSILAGSTSESVNIFIADSASTTGAGLTGLVFNSAGLTAYYTHSGTNAAATAITLATLAAVGSAYSSGGFKEIDATNMPGWYRLDLPNAVLAASKGRCVAVHLKGATNMAPLPIEIELTATNNQSSTVLLSSGTGTGQLDFTSGILKVDVNTIKTQTVTCAAGVTVLASVGTAATSTAQTGDSFARLGANGAGLTALGDTRLANLDVASSTLATAAALTTVDDFLDTEIAAIKAKTDNLPAAPAAVGDIPTANENADALLGRNLAGGSSTGRTVTQALCFLRNKWTVAAGTLTVYATDDTTTSWSATVSTDAAALPVTGNDPA